MAVFDPKVYEDKKVKQTLEMLEQGKTREEISDYFGHGVPALNQYFYRRGFSWDGQTYVPKENDSIPAAEEAMFVNTKAGQVVRQLSQKRANIQQIANKHGFPTVDELGDYMKTQGYVWNGKAGNYEYDETIKPKQQAAEGQSITTALENGTNLSTEYESILTFLLSKKEKLIEILEAETEGTLPRYKFRGAKANKTLTMATTLQTLLEDYSDEYNVTQRAIIEIALVEFFKKYGYHNQLNSVLLA